MSGRLLISGDSHVIEPPDLFTKTLSAKYGEAVPRRVSEFKGTKGQFYFTGYEYFRVEELVEGEGETQKKILAAMRDPEARLRCLDEDGVWAEILNATSMLYTMRARNDDLVRDCCEVFNDWQADVCSVAPKRLFGTGMIHMQDVKWAVQELERIKKKGLRSAIINCDARPEWEPYRSRKYDPFWSAAQSLDIPITLHIITGNIRDPFTLHGEERSEAPRLGWGVLNEAAPVLSCEFLFGGIMDRFADLRIVLSEFEVSWLPYWIFRNEQRQTSLGPALGIPLPKRPIREYLTRIFHGVVDDPFLSRAVGIVDPTTIMWGSDFPHPRCTYPNSQKIVDDILKDLALGIRDDIAFWNAARLYDIDPPAGGREGAKHPRTQVGAA